MTTLTEKILKLKSLGVDVSMKSTVDSINYRNDNYNQLGMHPNMTEEEVENGIDEKLKFYETHPWITTIRQLNGIPTTGLCQWCHSYEFKLQIDADRGDYHNAHKLETCRVGHFTQVYEDRHKPITVCQNFKPF